jgi:hypothetical protein
MVSGVPPADQRAHHAARSARAGKTICRDGADGGISQSAIRAKENAEKDDVDGVLSQGVIVGGGVTRSAVIIIPNCPQIARRIQRSPAATCGQADHIAQQRYHDRGRYLKRSSDP